MYRVTIHLTEGSDGRESIEYDCETLDDALGKARSFATTAHALSAGEESWIMYPAHRVSHVTVRRVSG